MLFPFHVVVFIFYLQISLTITMIYWLTQNMHPTVQYVQCTVYSVQCTVYSVQYVVYTFTVYSVYCTLISDTYLWQNLIYKRHMDMYNVHVHVYVHCTLYIINCIIYTVHCTRLYFTVYSVQRILCISQYITSHILCTFTLD